MTTKQRSWNRLLAVMLSISLACSMGTVTAYAADADSGGEIVESGEAPPDPGGEEAAEQPPDTIDGEPVEDEAEPPEEVPPDEESPPEEAEQLPEDEETPSDETESPADEAETPAEPPAEAENEPEPAQNEAEPAPIAVYASNVTIDGIHYSLSGTTATVTGGDADLTELIIPDTIAANDTEYAVTRIADNAFYSLNPPNTTLTRVDLGSVTGIGSRAFCGCKALTEVTGADGLTRIEDGVFLACAKLEHVSGLQNVTSLGTMAFMNCPALTTLDGLNWPSLTNIGQQAFFSCDALALELTADTFSGLKSLGDRVFCNMAHLTGTLVLPESITVIPQSAFSSTGLTAVYLPDSVQTIGAGAFYKCAALTAVQVGQPGGQSSRLNTIESRAFSGDTAITSFVIEAREADVSIKPNTTRLPTIPDGVEVKYTLEGISGTSIYAEDKAPMTLQQAIDAAAGGDTITAERSFIVESTVTVPAGKSVTLTDGGQNLVLLPALDFKGPVFRIEAGASLTLAGTFSCKGHRLTDGVFAEVNGALTLAGGSISRVSSDAAERGAIVVSGGAFTMSGGEITDCTFGNQYSGAVVLRRGTMHMTGGSISGNKTTADNAAGGVLVQENAVFTMDGGTISENIGTRGAGVLVGLPNSAFDQNTAAKFVLNAGTIADNTANPTAVNAGGGGVFVQDNALFTMNGGIISGNKVTGNGMGGGVATANPALDGGGRFEMNGGTISGNAASSGGGVYSCSKDTVVLRGGRITDNRAAQNGGGVYVSEPPYNITIEDALVTGNTATVMGGGLWSCPTGTVRLGTRSAIFGNTAEKAGDDLAFLNKYEGYFSTFAGKLLGGGLVTWYADNWVSGNQSQWGSHGAERFDAARPGNPVAPAADSIGSFSLKAVVSSEAQRLAENSAKLVIQGNTATRGGGIGTNGAVLLPGEDAPGKPVSVTVRKVWSGTSTHPDTVTVHLLRINADGTQTDLGTVILSEKSTDRDGNAWAYTFENLDGSYTYTVSEDAVSGFNTAISGTMENGFTITNSKKSSGGGGGGGGGRKPTPDPDPTPEPDPEPPIDIPDEPIPVEPLPPIEEPDEPTPEPEPPVEEPERPSRVPRTGDMSGLWAALCALSALGLAAVLRKRKS